jgi:hypothetical protein
MTSNKSIRRNPSIQADVPRHQKRAVKHKPYGIEQQSAWTGEWCLRQWYATRKARDQAFDDLTTKTTILRGTSLDTPVRKIDR